MTPQQKVAAIKKIEQEFLEKVDALKKEYFRNIRGIKKDIEARKIDRIRKELKS